MKKNARESYHVRHTTALIQPSWCTSWARVAAELALAHNVHGVAVAREVARPRLLLRVRREAGRRRKRVPGFGLRLGLGLGLGLFGRGLGSALTQP